MTNFLNSLGSGLITGGFICIVVAIGLALIQFFASLDTYTTTAGAAGFINPITTLIMMIILIFKQPDRYFPSLLVALLGVVLIVIGSGL